MKAFQATVTILLDPRVIGPDASTEWKDAANAADYFSNLLSGNEILDWRYEPVRSLDEQYAVVDVDPETYIEGDMDRLAVAS